VTAGRGDYDLTEVTIVARIRCVRCPTGTLDVEMEGGEPIGTCLNCGTVMRGPQLTHALARAMEAWQPATDPRSPGGA
jgi:hypothetical protein